MPLPFTQVKYEEDRWAEQQQPDLPPVRREPVPAAIVLHILLSHLIVFQKRGQIKVEKSNRDEKNKCCHHEVLPAEDDPETEEHRVEDALLDVLKQQHPRPLKDQREPLHRQVEHRHGDTQSEDHPGGGRGRPG